MSHPREPQVAGGFGSPTYQTTAMRTGYHQTRGLDRGSTSSTSSGRTLSQFHSPPAQIDVELLESEDAQKERQATRTARASWSPSTLMRQLNLADDAHDMPKRFSQGVYNAEQQHPSAIGAPQNFIRSMSPSNDSVHTSSSFTRSAAPIALFGDDTDYSDSDAEAGPSSVRYGPMQSSVLPHRPLSDALGLGFNDADLDLSFEDSPIAERNHRRAITQPQRTAGEPRSPSLRHVGRLPRRDLGAGSGSDRGSIIGLSSPENSPQRRAMSRLSPHGQGSPTHLHPLQIAGPSESFFTPKVGGKATLVPDQVTTFASGSLSERTPSASQKRTPRSMSSSAAAGSTAEPPPMPPLPVLKTKVSLSAGSMPKSESFSSFRSPSSRPTLLLAATRESHSPRSPDSVPTEAPTPSAEDYDAGESGFSNLTGPSSSLFGSSSMLAYGRNNSTSTGASSSTNSPRVNSALVPVYSDMESESEGFPGLVGLRQASTVSERWDEDFLFQEETGDDEPSSSGKTKRKGRRKERHKDKVRTASAPIEDHPHRHREGRAHHFRGQPGAGSSAARETQRGSEFSISKKPQQKGSQGGAQRTEHGDDQDGSDDSSSSSDEEGGDNTMQEPGRDRFDDDDDDEEEENWDGELSMLSGASPNLSLATGKMTASSSARTIMPATPSNLLMTGTSARVPSGHSERTPTGLGSRRVTPKASKKSSISRLQPPAMPSMAESARRARDARTLKPPKAAEDEGTASGGSSQGHDGNGRLGLSSSANSHQASTSSRSSGTVAQIRHSMLSNSTDGKGSNYADSLHRKAAGSISASTDFSARLAAQSEISSWHGHGRRSNSLSGGRDLNEHIDLSGVEIREDPVARQPVTAIEAETRAQTQERARAWVEENSRETPPQSAVPHVRKSSGKRKQPAVFPVGPGSGAEDTETEDRAGPARPQEHSSQARALKNGKGAPASSRMPISNASRSPSQSPFANLLSFNSKKAKDDPASPKDSLPLARRIRTTSRVQKLTATEQDSRPPSRAGSTSSRSPETQRDRIKKLLVQQHKQRKSKLNKSESSAGDQSPVSVPGSPEVGFVRRRTLSQKSRSKLAVSQTSPDVARDAQNSLRPPVPPSPGRASSPFGRSWDAIRSVTTNGLHRVSAEPNAKDDGLPSSTSAGALEAVRAASPTAQRAATDKRPRHGRTGSSLSISFGITKPFASSSGEKGKGSAPESRGVKSGTQSQRLPDSSVRVAEREGAQQPDSSYDNSPSSSPSARIFLRKGEQTGPPQRGLPSAIISAKDGSREPADLRSASSSTAVTNSSSLASSDFWGRQGEASGSREVSSGKIGRRFASGGSSSNTTTPTLGSPDSPRIKGGTLADATMSLPSSRRPSESKASVGRQSRRPSATSERREADRAVGSARASDAASRQERPKDRQISGGSNRSQKAPGSRPSGVSALKSSPEGPVPPAGGSQMASSSDTVTSKFVLRRNSLSDLKIPSRISRAQDGIRANMTYLRDFARGISELKALQARYHAALLEMHKHQEAGRPVDAQLEEILRKLDDVEHTFAPWWECADVLIGLGDGRGEADRSASLDTLTHSPAPVANRNRRITLNTPPRPMQIGNTAMAKDLSSDAASSLVSDSSSNLSVRRTDTSSAVSRASSMSGRQVAAQREMDILSLMLAGAPLDSSFTYQAREGGSKSSSGFQAVIEDPISAGSGQNSTSGHSTHSLTFAEPSPQKDDSGAQTARQSPYRPYGVAANSTTSVAATSTDSFSNLHSLDPDKSGRRKLRNASRAGLQGLRELLRSFKLSSNAETDSSGNFAGDSSVSTPADESITGHASAAHHPTSYLDGRASQSKQVSGSHDRSSRPDSAMGAEPSPTRRRSKIFSLVAAGLSGSRLDLPVRQRVTSTASSGAHSSSHADGMDSSADSGWAHAEFDGSDALRASTDSIRVDVSSPSPSLTGPGQVTPSSGARHRLFSLGRQLIGSRPRGDSFTSKQSISPANLSTPLPAVENEAVSPGGDSAFSNISSSVSERAPSRAESSMGPPDSSDQLTLGRKQGDRLHMGLGMSGGETVRRSGPLAVSSGEPRRPSMGPRLAEPARSTVMTRPPAFGRSFSASPSPGPSPSNSMQQIPAVPLLPPPLVLEGMTQRARELGSSATTASSLGGESWGSLGSDSDRGLSAAAAAIAGRADQVTITTDGKEPMSPSSSTLARPTTASDAATMSRFRKLILRPDAIRSLLAYVQATKNNCDTALVEVSRLAEAMGSLETMAEGRMAMTGGAGAPRKWSAVSSAHRLDEADEEEKEMMGTIRSPSATTPKRASLLPGTIAATTVTTASITAATRH